ncbi:sn-glycerol-3-phosphate ABC transporter ATP-binding protein UgpC [Agrobacterium vitis]|uniref:ABC transporter ATP-binding protein n=1 Tax=Rhizobium/Agrobacterium group TaxID=227290 RepID=UPI0008DC0FD7|nr:MULTISPECIES: sn-glycerol-3-phosphate ABC transporter ATP-binding protein UgpC [Rhizobium/Agrobacterium group]MCF1432901.1 sn-glycerol-3-phosphate ABC transporter ATP-binding protein UgpC [Allorhizobium ampelinum]MCF1460863.1 sn-glycerol-3-phosphate ABC transporter ATP-binding protein UgpC [Allorhizobium ampelinum]MUO89749.1 sn-glycerol-3-phosphate ABC transporter ATP-binding protein UgpC [Agrobacterium vitis]MUZ51309.1 sn-glycerol-3-phosphate ABC transporter ATP-binding protein UgpC [Agroba
MATSVTLQKVFKRYGALEVIHGVDLEITPGEFVVFVGPSGCGKSTLLRMIAGLEPISGGTLLLDGQRMNEVPAAKRGIAMVFQSYALYPHMTVYKNLAFGLETAGMKKKDIEPRVERAADILQIQPLLGRKPKALSGGQRQRVAIGRAIVREPNIFLFDEPLSNLDAELRVQMRVEIAKLHQSLGNTMIYVTHDQVEAMTMADTIVVLKGGYIEQVGAPLDLYNNPKNKFVAGFIGSPRMNFIDTRLVEAGERTAVELNGKPVDLARTSPGAQVGQKVSVGVRPEHLSLRPAEITLGEAHVDLVEHLGGQTILYLSMQDGQSIAMVMEDQQAIRKGEKVTIHIDSKRCYLFDDAGNRVNGGVNR